MTQDNDTPIRHKLAELLAEASLSEALVAAPAGDIVLESITDDSRQVRPGTLFVAVEGTAADGHRYIGQAIAAGATAIVCRRMPDDADPAVAWIKTDDTARALGLLASAWWGHPSRRLTLVGVTGTNGKTTIATLLYQLAGIGGLKAGLLSTVVNRIGTDSVPATHTTPGQLELQQLLHRMVQAGCTFVAMEVSSHAAAQQRIAGLDFDGAVFTNLTRDHLDYHGTFARYLAAKKSFFDALPSKAFALTNLDDRNGPVMLQNTAARKATYSLRSQADFCGRVVEDRLDGMLLSLNGQEVETHFAGRFNAANLTAVYGAACLLGWDKGGQLLQGISLLTPVAGRFQTIAHGGITAIVDYAHTPDALVNVLDTINEIRTPARRVITICGCGGERDKGKRPQMAAVAAARSNILIITSDNPRSEDPAAIIADMTAGLDAAAMARTLVNADRAQAIRTAVMLAAPGDIILLAGKGHEDYQVLATGKIHFDDREHITAALQERSQRQGCDVFL